MTTDERNALVVQYLPLIRRLARVRMMRSGQRSNIEWSDLYSIGSLSLVRDIERGVTNPGHLYRNAKSQMLHYIRSEREKADGIKSMQETLDSSGAERLKSGYLDGNGRRVNRMTLRKALRTLPRSQSDAYLYCEILGYNLTECGTILGITFQSVHENLQRAKSALENIFSAQPEKIA